MADLFFLSSTRPAAAVQAGSAAWKRLSELCPASLVEWTNGPGWVLVTSRNPSVPYDVFGDADGGAVKRALRPLGIGPPAERRIDVIPRGIDFGIIIG